MQNAVKRIVILEMTIFVLTAHSMMDETHVFSKSNLRNANPLVNMKKLSISMLDCFERHSDIFCNDELLNDKGSALSLAAIKFLEESDSVKNKKILETIKTAVSQGTPVESQYYPSNELEGKDGDHFYIFYNQKPTSIFKLIRVWCARDSSIDEAKKDALMNAIFQGGHKRQKQLACMDDKLRAAICCGLKIDISEDLMLFILSWDEKYAAGKKEKELVKQAEGSWKRERK